MDKKLFYLIIFITAVSVCAGTFYQILISDTTSQLLISQLESTLEASNMSSVINKMFKSQLSLIIILLSSFIPVFLPAIFIIPVIKGFSYGFSAAMLISLSGIKGVLQVFITILPFAIIQIAVYALAGCLALSMRTAVHGKSVRRMKTERFIKLYLILAAALLIICILETCLQVLIL